MLARPGGDASWDQCVDDVGTGGYHAMRLCRERSRAFRGAGTEGGADEERGFRRRGGGGGGGRG